MNIIFIRDVIISKTYHVNCEIQLVKALNRLGNKTKLIGIGDKNTFGEELILLKCPFDKRKYLLLKLLFFLPIYCINKKIDAVILDQHIIPATIFLLFIKRIFKIKVILDVRSIPVEMDLPWDYKISCQFARKFFDGVSYITPGTQFFIEDMLKSKFKKSTLFPSSVNPAIFYNGITNNIPLELKERTKKTINIFYHGSISPNRGINLILDALNQIKNKFSNILFISISDNNEFITEYCKKKKYNLSDNLLLIDIVPHEKLPSYINLADLCIVPLPKIYWWEISSPLKLMEYLAMEKTIILSDIKAHLDIVPRDSDFVKYFNPDKTDDLSQKIVDAISNLGLLKSNAWKGREIIKQKYTWDIQAKTIEDFVRKI